MKVHFVTVEGTGSPITENTFPQVVDIKSDRGETRELFGTEGYAHLTKPIMGILGELSARMRKYPNITPGEDFPGYGQRR